MGAVVRKGGWTASVTEPALPPPLIHKRKGQVSSNMMHVMGNHGGRNKAKAQDPRTAVERPEDHDCGKSRNYSPVVECESALVRSSVMGEKENPHPLFTSSRDWREII